MARGSRAKVPGAALLLERHGVIDGVDLEPHAPRRREPLATDRLFLGDPLGAFVDGDWVVVAAEMIGDHSTLHLGDRHRHGPGIDEPDEREVGRGWVEDARQERRT